ncbi:MAG TPA: glucosaminidase domain-containing protein [Acetobacteraceae bacterium]|nr:glucosaminidase domain-containing protein [Acetobacteraceae bacterium]
MNEDRPFGYETLKLRAVFVPKGNPGSISAADITDYFGHDVVRLRYSWHGSEGGGLELEPAPDRADGGESAAGPMQDADDPGFAPSGPPTARAMPPTPTLARAPRYVDPVRTAVATWRLTAAPSASKLVPSADRRQPVPPPQVAQFFENRAIYEEMAKRLDTDAEFLMALSSWESGWGDAHNRALHNLFGVTNHGANNLSFASDQEAADYWVTHYGSYVRGARTMDEFIAGLRRAHYNPHAGYYDNVKKRLETVRKYRNTDRPE